MKPVFLTLAMVGALVAPAFALASGLQVMPTRLEVPAGKIASITVKNSSESPINVQARALHWQQAAQGGHDIMREDAEDLIWYPKIFTVEPGGQQVVRVGSKTPSGDTERSYRLFIREVPVAIEGQPVTSFAIRMSIPVFIAPADSSPAQPPDLLEIRPAAGQLVASVHNGGNRYSMMHPLEVHGISADPAMSFTRDARGWYVLPGATRQFDLGMTPGECMGLHSIRLVARTRFGDTDREFDIDPAWCEKMSASVPAVAEIANE